MGQMFLIIKENSEESTAIMFKRIFLDTNPIIIFWRMNKISVIVSENFWSMQ